MKHYSHGIDGLRSGLSPSAKPFAIGSSSSPAFSLKSEHEDSIWGDYTLDLSFLSSDDQRSGLDDDDSLSNLSRDVETNKEGLVLEEKIASSGKVLVNPNPSFSKLPEVLIKSSDVVGDAKLGLSCVSEKSSTESDLDESEEDSPCWKGMLSHKSLASGTKSMTSRRSTDDLSGFRKLNPLAPQFIPSSSKKKLETDGEKCEETSSSSLKKSLSSTFPSSSGEFDLTEPPLEDGRNDAAQKTSILTHNADEILGFVTSDSVSKTVSMLDSRNEFQPSKRLDPLAPVFVPSSAKLSPSVHEKLGDFVANAYSTSALASSHVNSLDKGKVVTSSGEVGHSFKSQYGGLDFGSTSSYSPWIESEGGITEYAKLGSSNKSQGQRRLNPLARQFSFADAKQKPYGYGKNQAADDLSLVVNTSGLYIPARYREDHNVVDADLAQSSVNVERFLPNMSHGGSSLITPKADSNFGSTKWIAVEPNPTFSVKGNRDFKHHLPFHVVETAASSSTSDMKALPGPSPKMDVKKLLTTMHGLSELLTLAHGSESSDSPNAEELDLINSTVQNLNLYIQNNSQEHTGNQSVAQYNSYDLKLLPNKSKLSIRDHQFPTANNMTVDLDVKRKDKYSVVSRETVPGSRSYQYGATEDNGFGQVVPTNGYQQHQGVEQINQNALFYKSLWLKAEADRCLMVYETSLSNPYP
ncbi:unnamed protein product [Arabidopsis thaliana]|uniref:(thale cress) hypothetical protein n=1 Tax=Arabidopsis thaliana TaxID=3702 RepID=A0A7G2DXT7_ARATH|nr:unnamed protein product [Arabidopsis thaliana]